MQLYDPTGTTLLATTTTDENGHYYFANLPAATYVVKVDTEHPAGRRPDEHRTIPDGGTATANPPSTLTAGQINLAQDFGYKGTGTIGNLVWNDTNGDGVKDAGETGIAGVTVDLYWDVNGNGVLDAATSSSARRPRGGGAYSFANLGVTTAAATSSTWCTSPTRPTC